MHMRSDSNRYAQVKEDEYVIDPNEPAHIKRLLSEVATFTRGIIHLCALDTPELPSFAVDLLRDPRCAVNAARVSCGSALHVIQALIAESQQQPPRLWFVTRGAQHVLQTEDNLGIAQAPLLGLTRVCAIEHPDLRSVRIDLDGDGSENISLLANELFADGSEQEVAFRGGVRYLPRLVRSSRIAHEVRPMRANGAYLVIGGLRGLGLLTAELVVQRGGRCVVLAGRSPPDTTSLIRIEELRRRGAKVNRNSGGYCRCCSGSRPLEADRFARLTLYAAWSRLRQVLDDGGADETQLETVRDGPSTKVQGS